jgi:hypothetical protein
MRRTETGLIVLIAVVVVSALLKMLIMALSRPKDPPG